jgi:hypothetical protein
MMTNRTVSVPVEARSKNVANETTRPMRHTNVKTEVMSGPGFVTPRGRIDEGFAVSAMRAV